MRARDIMTTSVVTTRPDTSIREIAVLLSRGKFSGLPVVDAKGGLLGIVSEGDLILAEIKENQGIPPATQMLHELVNDNETATRSIRVALSTAQAAGDEATAGLLADRLAYHERQLWMMKSMAAS